jgi:hypothetical protein
MKSPLVLLSSLAACHGLTVGVRPAKLAGRTAAASMDALVEKALVKTRAAGEGEPFIDGVRQPVDGPRPDIGLDSRAMDAGYIECDEEPWHATCRPRVTLQRSAAQMSFAAALPFIAPVKRAL